MNRPVVTVGIETITARHGAVSSGSLGDDLAPTLAALDAQTYPRALLDLVVVLDDGVPAALEADLGQRFPFVRTARSPLPNYYAAKNTAARIARGDVVALVDADCVPAADWVERLVDALVPDVAAVAGRTWYDDSSRWNALWTVTDFARVGSGSEGGANGFIAHNVLLRREILLAHPFDERLRRNGGCTLLYHQLRAAGHRVAMADEAVVHHGGGDVRGVGIIRKHLWWGYDSVDVYRRDGTGALGGTGYVRRFGPLALLPITARRIVLDWRDLMRGRRRRARRTVGAIEACGAAAAIRLVELVGMVGAYVVPRRVLDRIQ